MVSLIKHKKIIAIYSSLIFIPCCLYASPTIMINGVNKGAAYTNPGSYTSTGGDISVNGGGQLTIQGGLYVGNNNLPTTSNSHVLVDGINSSLNVHGSYLLGESTAGSSINKLEVTNGAKSYIEGMLSLGHAATDSGTVIIDGKGSTLELINNSSGIVKVGDEGNGQLVVQNSGKLTAHSINISNNTVADGLLTITGSGTEVNVKNLVVGNGGSGTLMLSDSASLNVDQGNGTIYIAGSSGTKGKFIVGDGNTTGHLSASEIAFGLGDGTLEFNFNDPDWKYDGSIKGKGTVVKNGGGTLNLDRDNSYFNGQTQINNGKLILGQQTNSKLGGNVSIGKNGILEGNAESIMGAVDNDGHLVFDQNTNDAYAQKISGTGTIIKKGQGKLILASDSSNFNGVTDVTEGTLVVGDAQGNGKLGGDLSVGKNSTLQMSSASISGAVNLDGTGIFQQDNDGEYNQNMSGSGELDKKGEGVLRLTGNNSNFKGNTLIKDGAIIIDNNGTLGGNISVDKDSTFKSNARAINGDIKNEGEITFDQTNDAIFSQTLSGSGGVFKNGPGVLTITGNESGFNGIIAITGGTVALSTKGGYGTLGGTVNALQDTVFEGDGTIEGDVNIYQQAIHKPGTQESGSQTIKGNYTNYGSLTETGQSDYINHLVVYGDIDISGATLNLDLSPQNKSEWKNITGPFYVIDNKGSDRINGEFWEVNNNLMFLTPLLNYEGGDGNDLTLTYTRNDKDFSVFAKTKNQKNTARAINTLPGDNTLWQGIALSDDINTLQNSLETLSGEIYPAIQSSIIENTHFVRDVMSDRLHDLDSHKISEFNYGSTQSRQEIDNSAVMWSRAYGSWDKNNATVNTVAQKTHTNGILLGMDIPKSYGRLGVLFGYGSSRVIQKSTHSSANLENYYAGVYGGHEWKKLSLRTGVAAGWHNIKSERDTTFNGFNDKPSGTYKARTGQVFSELGYKLSTLILNVEPFINASYVYEKTDAFKESGKESSLQSQGSDKSAVYSVVGVKTDKDFLLSGKQATIYSSIGLQHTYSDVSSTSTLSFTEQSENYQVNGTSLTKNAINAEAGIGVKINSTTNASISYKGTMAKNSMDNGIFGNINYLF